MRSGYLSYFKIYLYLVEVSSIDIAQITTWLMEPGGSMPQSQGLSKNPYPKPNQFNSSD